MSEVQYRLLNRDDIKAPGDEYIVFDKLGDWKVTQEVGRPVGDWDSALYRRRIDSIKQQWIPLSERLPDKWPVWVTDGKEVCFAKTPYSEHCTKPGYPCCLGATASFDYAATHFLPIEFPPLPPRKSAEEVAFEKAAGSLEHVEELREIWLAALEFAKGEK